MVVVIGMVPILLLTSGLPAPIRHTSPQVSWEHLFKVSLGDSLPIVVVVVPVTSQPVIVTDTGGAQVDVGIEEPSFVMTVCIHEYVTWYAVSVEEHDFSDDDSCVEEACDERFSVEVSVFVSVLSSSSSSSVSDFKFPKIPSIPSTTLPSMFLVRVSNDLITHVKDFIALPMKSKRPLFLFFEPHSLLDDDLPPRAEMRPFTAFSILLTVLSVSVLSNFGESFHFPITGKRPTN